jgi:hypothetical protein|tara:strand:+ start:343 stop:540 length:198 start_codon:yes stop_codon:yes gene_type:complete
MKKGPLLKVPAFLFFIVAGVLVISIAAISIASLPLGIGSTARELLGSAVLVFAFYFLLKVIHSFV